MIEILVQIFEGALKTSNIVYTILISLLISFISWLITRKKSEFVGVAVAIMMIIGQYILYRALFDKVKSEQTTYIETRMYDFIDTGKIRNCFESETYITDWRSGFKKIESCPKEIGYLITTADYLVKDYKNYEAASLLLEISLDYLPSNPMPPDICERLKKYLEYLPDKNYFLDDNCIKNVATNN